MSKLTEKQENKLQKIRQLRPIDDSFFQRLAEDKEVCQEILRVILNDKELIVTEVIPQNSVKNLYGRSVILDVLCIRGDGKKCNVEVEKNDNKNHFKRSRYNAACITTNIMDPGEEFENVPDVDVVYISAFDFINLGKVIYHVNPTITETGTVVDNGHREIYVNTQIKDNSEVSELMQCFLQTNVDNDKFPKLSDKVKYYKEDERGVKVMCKFVEECREEGREEMALMYIKHEMSKKAPKEFIICNIIDIFGICKTKAEEYYAMR